MWACESYCFDSSLSGLILAYDNGDMLFPKWFEGDASPFLGKALHILRRKRRRVGMEVHGQNEERARTALLPAGG